MDFTREPIIETVITPKEGCKLVVRNSKGTGQEEYFVDAVEVVTFGSAIFLRSLEKPKAFMVPASDYEVLEVREARIVLKNVGFDRSIKIGGGREAVVRSCKESNEENKNGATATQQPLAPIKGRVEGRTDRKRDRRRQSRRRGRDEVLDPVEEVQEPHKSGAVETIPLSPPVQEIAQGELSPTISATGALMTHLLAPPPLISETIGRYKKEFKDAFYTKEEQEVGISLDPAEPFLTSSTEIMPESSEFSAFDLPDEGEEEIYRQQRRRFLNENPIDNVPETTGLPQEESSQEGSSATPEV